jgi:hypothetical protein
MMSIHDVRLTVSSNIVVVVVVVTAVVEELNRFSVYVIHQVTRRPPFGPAKRGRRLRPHRVVHYLHLSGAVGASSTIRSRIVG